MSSLLPDGVYAQVSRLLTRVVVHYVSSTAEDIDFCGVGAGLRRLSALRQDDMDG